MTLSAVRTIASLWLPPLALMALIFFLSGQPNLSSGLGLIDLVGRKLVHAVEFGLLCFLWWRALSTLGPPRAALVAATAIAVAYAITDELHQSFVPTRNGAPGDVAIDTAGALIAVVLVRRRAGLARLPPPREATSTSPEALPRPAGSTTTPPATDAASRRP